MQPASGKVNIFLKCGRYLKMKALAAIDRHIVRGKKVF